MFLLCQPLKQKQQEETLVLWRFLFFQISWQAMKRKLNKYITRAKIAYQIRTMFVSSIGKPVLFTSVSHSKWNISLRHCLCLHSSWSSLSNDVWGSGWESGCRKLMFLRHNMGAACLEATFGDARQAAWITLTDLKSWNSPPVWLCCRWLGKRNFRRNLILYLRALSSIENGTGEEMLTIKEEKHNALATTAPEVKTGIAVSS